MTDITAQKRRAQDAVERLELSEQLESSQKQRMEEALESKRQQENFIDMTSHEMRNPLSAVIQCADSIMGDLEVLRKDVAGREEKKGVKGGADGGGGQLGEEGLGGIVDSAIEAAQTIISCSQHQKRIVDDTLTLSKLDSKLLQITPVTVQPVSWSALCKFFEPLHIPLDERSGVPLG